MLLYNCVIVLVLVISLQNGATEYGTYFSAICIVQNFACSHNPISQMTQ